MLSIDKEDLDSSLYDFKNEFKLEERFLTEAECECLVQLREEEISNISSGHSFDDEPIYLNRLMLIHNILTIDLCRILDVIIYLEKPLTELPEYSDKKLKLEEINFRSIDMGQVFELRERLIFHKEHNLKEAYDVSVSRNKEKILYDNITYFDRIISAIVEHDNVSKVYEGMYRINRLFDSINWSKSL